MIFSSIPFIIFLGLIVIVLKTILFGGKSRVKQTWLILFASLFFYSYWNPPFLILLLVSVLANHFLAGLLASQKLNNNVKNLAFWTGILFNLGLIAYYKYAFFIIENINYVLGTSLLFREEVFLPLGISFFTFQQIAFLVDCKEGNGKRYNLKEYCLFISFFPQLIAGPIVHHKEMMPQFSNKSRKVLSSENLMVGITLFSFGLFKKLLIADNAALISEPFFFSATVHRVFFLDSWIGVLAYSFQIYFDFSGYCDMALGLARMFGIILPINFYSPYKSNSIIDFWRTWHITLSRFLKDYIYIPLGGNRKGKVKRYLNLITTMLIGGLWHGASWTFVIWGGLHGIYLTINHMWRFFLSQNTSLRNTLSRSKLSLTLGTFITFISVSFAWVFFKASTFQVAFKIISGMVGLNGFGHFSKSELIFMSNQKFESIFNLIQYNGNPDQYFQLESISILFIISIVVFVFPNPVQILKKYNPAIDPSNVIDKGKPNHLARALQFKPNLFWSILVSVLFVISVLNMSKVSPFIYFQF